MCQWHREHILSGLKNVTFVEESALFLNGPRHSTVAFLRVVPFEAKSSRSRFCQIISARSVSTEFEGFCCQLSDLEVQLTTKATAHSSARRGVILPTTPDALSCIFIFSWCLIHYCQLIRCKADIKTCRNFIKKSPVMTRADGDVRAVLGRQTGGG